MSASETGAWVRRPQGPSCGRATKPFVMEPLTSLWVLEEVARLCVRLEETVSKGLVSAAPSVGPYLAREGRPPDPQRGPSLPLPPASMRSLL